MGSAQVRGKLWGAAAADWWRLTEPALAPVYRVPTADLGSTMD